MKALGKWKSTKVSKNLLYNKDSSFILQSSNVKYNKPFKLYIHICICIYIYLYIYIYSIMKTMCSPSYPQNSFVASHALGDVMCIMYNMCPRHDLPQSHCCDNREGTLFSWLYMDITPVLFLWDLSTLCVMDHFWPLI